MGIYTSPHSGTKVYRNRKRIKNNRKIFNLTFGECFPVFTKFVLPGDIWKLRPNCFVRYMPTLAPVLTEVSADFRFFFVPLRQVVENIEEIITGSKNGSLITSALPECQNFVKELLTRASPASPFAAVHKNSFYAAMGVRPCHKVTHEIEGGGTWTSHENYNAEVDASDIPAAYWFKAYCKIIFEYYRDENYQSFDGDFEKFYDFMLGIRDAGVASNGWYFSNSEYSVLQTTAGVDDEDATKWKLWFANVNKDYFMSSLPWIMKGAEPTINSVMHADFTNIFQTGGVSGNPTETRIVAFDRTNNKLGTLQNTSASSSDVNFASGSNNPRFGSDVSNVLGQSDLANLFNSNQITDGGFSAQDIRDLFAETRVFERLARCGSRYVEYLEANFGIAPRDDTLQRPLYLGGYQQPIVTTEVVQTGGSNTGDVGTLRGHGISSGGNSIRPFVATEFGVIIGIMCVKPKTQYLYQIDRQYTYMKRFDFFNPSFQQLSEQQVRNLEFYTPPVKPVNANPSAGDVIYDNAEIPRFTLGYQGMYNELRYDNDIICRDMADNLSYWTQALDVDSRRFVDEFATPPLNGKSICLGFYLKSLLRPFEAQNGDFKPMIVDFGMGGIVYRPMIKDPIPGLVDHH